MLGLLRTKLAISRKGECSDMGLVKIFQDNPVKARDARKNRTRGMPAQRGQTNKTMQPELSTASLLIFPSLSQYPANCIQRHIGGKKMGDVGKKRQRGKGTRKRKTTRRGQKGTEQQ
jgi:hypothetical protein